MTAAMPATWAQDAERADDTSPRHDVVAVTVIGPAEDAKVLEATIRELLVAPSAHDGDRDERSGVLAPRDES